MSTKSGDLGRRLKERREELDLTIAEVATAAAMAPAYLTYLENSAASSVSPATVFRLASVLQTTPKLLVGGGTQEPPGHSAAGRGPVLSSLSDAECLELLSPGGIGRVGFYGGERGTVIIPVNFRMLGQDVVFRTSAESSLSMVTEFDLVAFEVDHLDDSLSEGWSVLFSGHAHQVLEDNELARVQMLGDEPWAGGDRDAYIRLELSEVSGRRIRVQR